MYPVKYTLVPSPTQFAAHLRLPTACCVSHNTASPSSILYFVFCNCFATLATIWHCGVWCFAGWYSPVAQLAAVGAPCSTKATGDSHGAALGQAPHAPEAEGVAQAVSRGVHLGSHRDQPGT